MGYVRSPQKALARHSLFRCDTDQGRESQTCCKFLCVCFPFGKGSIQRGAIFVFMFFVFLNERPCAFVSVVFGRLGGIILVLRQSF
jgi:hypothetical protein